MRAGPNAVVLSSLLLVGIAGAQPASSGSGTSAPAPGSTPPPGEPGGVPAAAPGPGPGTPALPPAPGGVAPQPARDLSSVRPEEMPTAVRLRRLEQKSQALKERAWQLKARVQMLKEQMIGGGVGSQAMIAHADQMGASFRLTKLVYSLDGTQVFMLADEAGESMHKTKNFNVFAGPISPGTHNLQVVATYRGHGYGVFEYLSKFSFSARSIVSFTNGEGKIAKVSCRGYEKGNASTPMEKRPAIECKVTELQPEKPAAGLLSAPASGSPPSSPSASDLPGAPLSPPPSSTTGAPPSPPPSGTTGTPPSPPPSGTPGSGM